MTDSTVDSGISSDAAFPVPKLTATGVQPSGFQWAPVDPAPAPTAPAVATDSPPLGAIDAFVGTWVGSGFNTIFRPLQTPGNPSDDNILELNLTEETLSFNPSLGSIPNRGLLQPDAFLNGISYQQTISDATDPTNKVGIHSEPGVWLAVPATQHPAVPDMTYARLASIPHGTTILLQGTAETSKGGPNIPGVSITPTTVGGGTVPFGSQTASKVSARRIPENLQSFIDSGKITQAILDDPNTVLREAIAGQTITETTTISITSNPVSPLSGGGTDNIAFLLGDAGASTPNAQPTLVEATFWIETVQNPDGSTFKQIQYSQVVQLKFGPLLWPHVSVATLRPLHDAGQGLFQRVASAQTGVGTQYVAIGGGKLWHTIQNSDGKWQDVFRTIESQESNDPGEFTSVAVAGIGDFLHVVGIANGKLWHTFRDKDGHWQTFFGLVDAAASGDPGTFTAVSAFGLSDGNLQVTGVSEGHLWFTIRHHETTRWESFQRIAV